MSHTERSARLVLDTNVVLDWLLFNDPRAASLAHAITSGRCRWLATLPMRDELADVLNRGIAAKAARAADSALRMFDAHASICEPAPKTTLSAMRCTDPDDQPFIDLALYAGARALLSRDRAVLRLARSAARFELQIVVPERWAHVQG